MATKPALRNLLLNKSKKDFIVATIIAVVSSGAYYLGVKNQRKKAIEDFYKNYDIEKDYERKKRAGVFQMVNRKVEEGKIVLG